jgi:hypothetical protein
MKLPKNLGNTLLSFWLIATGLLPLLHLANPTLGAVLNIVAVAAGACLFLGR